MAACEVGSGGRDVRLFTVAGAGEARWDALHSDPYDAPIVGCFALPLSTAPLAVALQVLG